jgi:hypothetical protein
MKSGGILKLQKYAKRMEDGVVRADGRLGGGFHDLCGADSYQNTRTPGETRPQRGSNVLYCFGRRTRVSNARVRLAVLIGG